MYGDGAVSSSSSSSSYIPPTILGIVASSSPVVSAPPAFSRTSYIGGQPVWHDPSTAPSLEQLACRSCGSCSEVVLLAHIFCPIHERRLDRSLYIFVCNKRRCSLTHSGWSVVRNQKYRHYSEPTTSASTPAAVAESVTKAVAAKKTSSAWDFLSAPPGSAEGGSSTEGGLNDTMDELEALLLQRDCALKISAQAKAASPLVRPNASSSSSSNGGTVAASSFCKKAFPLRVVEDVLEPSRW